jgi:hypothetical protein
MKKLFAILITICLLAGALSISTSAALLSELDAVPVGTVLRVSALKKTASDKLETQVLKDFVSFQDGWNYAMEIAGDDDEMDDNEYERIVVDLLADWKANEKGEFVGSDGEGFENSTIYIPQEAKVMLNMNGHTINRGLGDNNDYDGEVICIDSEADVIINGGKNGDAIARADDEKATVQFGTITGGNSDTGAGGIHIQDEAKVMLNNVNIFANITDDDDGAGIAIYDGASLVMNGGGFIDNENHSDTVFSAGHGAAIYIYDSTARFNKVLFRNNQYTDKASSGAVVYVDSGSVTMNDCLVADNGIWDETNGAKGSHSTIYASKSNLELKNTTFTGNGSAQMSGGDDKCDVIYLYYTPLLIDTCIFTGNRANDDIIDGMYNYGIPSIVNSTFTGNDGQVIFATKTIFTNCTFNDNNKISPDMYDFSPYYPAGESTVFTMVDCDMGDSTYSSPERIKLVDTEAENGAEFPGAMFGEGSLTMIIAFIALIASIASIVVNVCNSNKTKKLVLAGTNETEEDN